jgi:Ca2+-binding EF-hand superfamily protein
MDTDADGFISASEHAAASARMFTTMDLDADGRVTAKEMTDAHQKVTGKKAKAGELSSEAKIKVVDGDGDGVLTAAEHQAGAATMFQSMDVVRDGKLSRAEMASARAKMLSKGGQKK